MIRLRASRFGAPGAFRLGGFAGQCPTTNAQLPKQLTLRVGAPGEVDTPPLPEGSVSALRRVVTAVALLVAGGGTSVLACPVCFGAQETPMIDGAKLGVLVMLGITLVVQGGFVGFFLYLRNRAKRIADVELDTEWSELQRSPRTS